MCSLQQIRLQISKIRERKREGKNYGEMGVLI